MSDTRDLRALLAEHGPTEDVYLYCFCGVNCGGEAGYALHLAMLIDAEFLVIPRTDITTTEYGWRRTPRANIRPTSTREQATDWARTAQRSGEVDAEAVEHVVAWSPIPLPEDGTE